MRTLADLRGFPPRFLMELRRLPPVARVLVALAMGGLLLVAALPSLAAVGINLASCPTGLESYMVRLVGVGIVAAVVIALPGWLLAVDLTPMVLFWSLLAFGWRFGPLLLSLLPS